MSLNRRIKKGHQSNLMDKNNMDLWQGTHIIVAFQGTKDQDKVLEASQSEEATQQKSRNQNSNRLLSSNIASQRKRCDPFRIQKEFRTRILHLTKIRLE